MYAYDPKRGTFGGGSLAPGTGKGPVVEARSKKEQEEIRKKAEAEAKKQAEAEAKGFDAAVKAGADALIGALAEPDPVATLPEATFGLPVGSPEGADEGSGEGGAPEPEPEPAQPTGPVSLAGGLAVGSGAPNVDMGKLAKSRGGLPYSFKETEQTPTEVYEVGSQQDHDAGLAGLKFPMTQAEFDALPTKTQGEALTELTRLGADHRKLILPTQGDVSAYQSRWERDQATNPDTFGLEGGAPEYRLKVGTLPRNYVDSRRPNEGRWIDPQTGDQYNVTEAYGRQLRQRMPQLVRPEVMDRMMGMGMAPKFMEQRGKGVDLDKFLAKREALQRKKNFKPKEGDKREEGLKQLDEEAREQIRQDREKATRGITPEAIEEGLRYVETGEYPEDPEEPLSEESKKDIAEQLAGVPLKIPMPPERFFAERDIAESNMTDADAFPPEAYGPNYSGMYSGVEDIPDAMDVSSDLNRPEAQVTAPEVDIPIDDDDEPDEGFDVQMDPEDVAAFREASENPLGPATAAYEALAEEDPDAIQFAPFEEAVEANIAQPRVTPELSDADLGPFIEAIFGEGTKATDEIIAQVREILSQEAYRGMTPAQVSQRWNQFRDPLQ